MKQWRPKVVPMAVAPWNVLLAVARPFQTVRSILESPGMADLLALDVARRNFDWDALWFQN
jgi:hypothetical protein